MSRIVASGPERDAAESLKTSGALARMGPRDGYGPTPQYVCRAYAPWADWIRVLAVRKRPQGVGSHGAVLSVSSPAEGIAAGGAQGYELSFVRTRGPSRRALLGAHGACPGPRAMPSVVWRLVLGSNQRRRG